MADPNEAVAAAAQRHGLSEPAVWTLWDALVAGRGVQAQFDHPELGGMGQWSGGMVQIGDMFDQARKATVAAVCAELAPLAAAPGQGADPVNPDRVRAERAPRWWPAALGEPASSGAQNATRYACFPDKRRLAVERDGAVTLYDTGEHRIFGISQQQSTCSALAFTSQFGAVMLDALPIVPA